MATTLPSGRRKGFPLDSDARPALILAARFRRRCSQEVFTEPLQSFVGDLPFFFSVQDLLLGFSRARRVGGATQNQPGFLCYADSQVSRRRSHLEDKVRELSRHQPSFSPPCAFNSLRRTSPESPFLPTISNYRGFLLPSDSFRCTFSERMYVTLRDRPLLRSLIKSPFV